MIPHMITSAVIFAYFLLIISYKISVHSDHISQQGYQLIDEQKYQTLQLRPQEAQTTSATLQFA
jgi:hypothetical protein